MIHFCSTEYEFYNKSIIVLETGSESSTISLPQEMSFAEEPIKASKPFLVKDPTEQPDRNSSVPETTAQHKTNSNVMNLIPTLQPTKQKPDKPAFSVTEQARESSISTYQLLSTAVSLLNVTPVEESHEVFNNDKDREVFQDSAVVKKSVKMDVVENVGNSLKNIVSKSSESEEEPLGDRTYNIEGTFDSNDFGNVDPINVYKRIDLTPLESTSKNTISYESTVKPTQKSAAAAVVTDSQSTSTASVAAKIETTRKPSTVAYVEPEVATNKTSTKAEAPLNETVSTERPKLKQKKISTLLSGSEDNENEANMPSRKRHIINSERHSFYPYFLGRILG